MTAVRLALWAAYWTAVAALAALVSILAEMPFTGHLQTAVALTVIGGVFLVGIAIAPYSTRKGGAS